MNITLEPAQTEDIEICNAIINCGREFQKEQGFVQWTNEYPNRDTIIEDVRVNKGYVLKVDGEIAGYMFVDFDGEPAYDNINGKWNTETPYAVVHRMAFDKKYRGMGLADAAFKLVEELCAVNNIKSIRIDTDFPNKRMQHILKKNGFENCGKIVFQDGEKLAFDKILHFPVI